MLHRRRKQIQSWRGGGVSFSKSDKQKKKENPFSPILKILISGD